MSRYRVVLSNTAYFRTGHRTRKWEGVFKRRMVVVSRQPHWLYRRKP